MCVTNTPNICCCLASHTVTHGQIFAAVSHCHTRSAWTGVASQSSHALAGRWRCSKGPLFISSHLSHTPPRNLSAVAAPGLCYNLSHTHTTKVWQQTGAASLSLFPAHTARAVCPGPSLLWGLSHPASPLMHGPPVTGLSHQSPTRPFTARVIQQT